MKNWIHATLRRNTRLFNRHYAFDALMALVALLLLIALGVLWVRLSELRQAQTWLLERNSQLLIEVIEFQREIGFGGFIHNFKNAVLRPNELFHLTSSEGNLAKSFQILDRIENLTISVGTPLDLQGIRGALERFAQATLVLREHQSSNLSPQALDTLVRVHNPDVIKHLVRLVEMAREDLLERIEAQHDAIKRVSDWLSVAAALLTTLLIFVARRRQIEAADIEITASRQTAYLFDQIAEAVIGLSEDRRIIFLNEAARNLLRDSVDAVPCEWPSDIGFAPRGIQDRNGDLLDQALAGEKLHELPAVMTGPGPGRRKQVRFSCQKIHEEFKNPAFSLIVVMREAGFPRMVEPIGELSFLPIARA